MTLIAIRQLTGDYGRVAPGGVFAAESDVAESLMSRGLARLYHPPMVEAPAPVLETKVITPETQAVPVAVMAPRPRRHRGAR